MHKPKQLPRKALVERLLVSPEGRLVWRDGKRAGCEAGFSCGPGYRSVEIEGARHYVHRVLYFLAHGVEPEIIDHIDGNPLNNVLSNLRAATHMENMQNAHRVRSDSLSGLKGVCKVSRGWEARIVVDGRRIRLGRFVTPELAHEAYVKAKRDLHSSFSG
jgi:hypothetical protein